MAARMIVPNENAPQIRFVRIRGRVVPIVQGKKKLSLVPKVEDQIQEMKHEISIAEKGSRQVAHSEYGDSKNFATQSTFPGWYKSLGFRNREEFLGAVKTRNTKKFDKVADEAIDHLKDGYESTYGRVPPDTEFRIKTRQDFDNTGVIFRKIDGKVRPLRFGPKIQKQRDDFDEVPF